MFTEHLVVMSLMTLSSLPAGWQGEIPATHDIYGALAESFKQYDVILRPDKIAPGWWAGAPSVVRDSDGVFWLACRMRTTDSPVGLRGYEIRILRSNDGIHFEKAHNITREEVPIPGFERPALLQDPDTKKFKLYGCGPWQEGPWCILKFEDADRPDQFIPSTAKPVIQTQPKTYERDVPPTEYKDPVILHAEGIWHCYVIGVVRRGERIFHFSSHDGEQWEPVGSPYEPILHPQDWHNFYVRPASVLPLGMGYLFVYEGSHVNWYDPVYNIATGIGFTFDLHRVQDLSPESPVLLSSTPNAYFHTFRYSHWMKVENEIWVYAEVAAPDETNEIRLFRIKQQP